MKVPPDPNEDVISILALSGYLELIFLILPIMISHSVAFI